MKRANQFMLFASELYGNSSLVLRTPRDVGAVDETTTAAVTA